MGWSEGELSLTLVNDRTMARLNRQTFGRRGPTSVIAFPVDGRPTPVEAPLTPGRATAARAPGTPPPLLGEVVISLETTARQARQTGWATEELFDFFLIHGILHLVGYDHVDPEGETRMTQKTWELLKLLHHQLEVT